MKVAHTKNVLGIHKQRFFTILMFAVILNCFISFSSSAVSNYSLSVEVPETPVLEITLLDSSNHVTSSSSVDVIPSMAGAGFNEASINVKVGTSNLQGYNLTMNASSTNLSGPSGAVIPSLVEDTTNHASGYTCTKATGANCDFTVNSWGYKIASVPTGAGSTTNYLAVPSTPTIITNYTTGATNGEITQVYFGSRVDTTKPSGSYTTTIEFIATANILPSIYMQDLKNSELAALLPDAGSTIYLKDARDERPYLIGKLADGRYWMLENLAYDPLNTEVAMSHSNTNATDTQIAAFLDTTTGVKDVNTGFNSYTEPQINTSQKDVKQKLAMNQSGNDLVAKVGVYYNYCAATAGTYCYNSTSGARDVQHDVCPAGWRLPTSGADGEYQALRDQYASDGAFALALRIGLGGFYDDDSVFQQGSYGALWSSTPYGSSSYARVYTLLANATVVDPQNSYNASARSGGYSVRCIKDITMQDIANAQLAELMPNEGDTTTLIDKRDGTEYLVGKLADGNYWMLENLALGSDAKTYTLTSADTNIASATNFTLPASVSTWSSSYTEPIIDTNYENTLVPLMARSNGETGKIGVYYNYCAASAGTYCYDSSSGTGDAQHDICPAGWRLPTGTDGLSESVTNTKVVGEFKERRHVYSCPSDFAIALNLLNSGTNPPYGTGIGEEVVLLSWMSGYSDGNSMCSTFVVDPNYKGAALNAPTGRRNRGYTIRCLKEAAD